MAWDILSENSLLKRFDPIRRAAGAGNKWSLKTPKPARVGVKGFADTKLSAACWNVMRDCFGLADVKDVAWDLGVSQATLYRLITTYKTVGTVEALRCPERVAGPAGLRLLDKKVEALIAKCIREIYLYAEQTRRALKRLTDEVHAKYCAAAGFSLPDRRTVRAWRAGDPGSDEDPAPIGDRGRQSDNSGRRASSTVATRTPRDRPDRSHGSRRRGGRRRKQNNRCRGGHG